MKSSAALKISPRLKRTTSVSRQMFGKYLINSGKRPCFATSCN